MKTSSIPDLFLINARVYTQDDANTTARAVAVTGNRICAVGSNEDILKLRRPSAQVIDLHDRTLIPGMMDSHIHFHEWSQRRLQLDLSKAPSLEAALEAVRSAAGSLERGKWLVGFGFNEVDWPEKRMPVREDLDQAVPDRPAVLWRTDLHLATTNSLALEQAGIFEGTSDPPEGRIDRDPAGRPTGILREMAINKVRDRMPGTGSRDVDHILEEGLSGLHALGLTGFHDIRLMNDRDGMATLQSLQRLRETDRLSMRSWVAFPGEDMGAVRRLGLRTGLGDERLRVGYLKFFSDGGMGARTAWMLEPYLDAETGMPMIPPKELEEAVLEADAAGLAVMVHAIGDRANREVIGIFERVVRARRGRSLEELPPLRHRIEHVQMIHPDDLKRLAALPVAACLTPLNMILDISLVDESVGPLGRRAYAIRDILDTGIPVVFSSDSPVCDPNPLEGIQAAVTRSRPDGTPTGGWYPQQRISVDEAIKAYTRIPAEIHGQGHILGRIAPGFLADLVVLEEDPYALPPERIGRIAVNMTLFDGRVVYAP